LAIPQLTMANFPLTANNFLRPLDPTKYAVFVAGKLPQLTQYIHQINWQFWLISDKFNISNIPTIRAWVAVTYFRAQSYLHSTAT